MKESSDDPSAGLVDAVLDASRVFVALAARSLADTADEVTLAQYRALVVLASRGPQNLAGLASNLEVAPATATRMCDRLVRKGLIRRTHDRDDRRSVRLSLSPKGRDLIDTVSQRRRQGIRRLLDAVPADERATLVRSLQLLTDAGGEVPEQAWSTGWDL